MVTEKDGAYELLVPVSRLSLTIPKGRFLPSKPSGESGNPRYFSFEDRQRGRSSNVRAEWIQAGTWIDLHLSVTANQSEAAGRTTLRDFLGTLQVSERTQ